MKQTVLYALFFFLLSTKVYTQTKLDSLHSIWLNQSLSQFERVDALIDYSEEYVKTNTDSALFFANMGYDFVYKNNIEKLRSKANSVLGYVYDKKGEYDLSKQYYLKALEIAKKNGQDNMIGSTMYSIGTIFYVQGDYETALDYYYKSIPFLEKTKSHKGLADVYNNLGIIFTIQNKYEEATEHYEKSVQSFKKAGVLDASPITNHAIMYTRKGDYAQAIKMYMKSLKINEENGDDYALGFTFNNIANLYSRQKDSSKYFFYVNKAIAIRRKLGNKKGLANSITNKGVVYFEYDDYDKSYTYLKEGLAIAEEINYKNVIGTAKLHLGHVYLIKGQYELALTNFNESLIIKEELGDNRGIAYVKAGLGKYYLKQNQYQKSLSNFSESLELAKGSELKLVQEVAFELYKLNDSLGNETESLIAFKLYVETRDSLDSEENQRELLNQELKYSYDKKAFADSLEFANEQKIQDAKLEETKNQRIILVVVLILVVGFSIILYGRIRLTRKQKNIIEQQNLELNNLNNNLEQKVEERTKEIKEINKSLKESDERYTYALDASNEGIWDYNVKEDQIKFSPAIYTQLGFEPSEFEESRTGIYGQLHSDELKKEKRKEHDLFIGNNDEDFLLDEYKMLSKNGNNVWIQVKGKIVEKDENGNPIRIVGTHTDITESKLRNKEILGTILKTENAERSRIAKDIHDGLQQTLTVSLLNFKGLKKELKEVPGEVMDKYDRGLEYLQQSINESRSVAHSLMPKAIEENGILVVCQNLTEDMNVANQDTEFKFSHNFENERIDSEQIEITLYRILQESLNNIVKYAKATTVDIQLKEYDDIFMLMIEDNGVGFNTDILKDEKQGLGFRSMKNRLDAINGFLEVTSFEGRGTTILVEINKVES